MAEEKSYLWHNISSEEAVDILKSDTKGGLTEKEVEVRQKFGKNALPEEKPLAKTIVALNQLKSPLIYILLIAASVTFALGEWTDGLVILAAVLTNTAVGFFQELKASNALNELKKILRVKTTVWREGKEKEVAQEKIVPGDIIVLKAGDKVPADARLVEAWNLKVSEAALTGEWLSAEKTTKILPEKTPLADRDNMVYLGTMIEEGEAIAVATAIGERTELGKVAGMIKEAREEKTPYQKKLSRFSKIVGIIIAVICTVIFIEGLLKGKEFVEMFITAVAIAVAAIPEGLPVAMTIILALGMQNILRKRGLVRKLSSAETLGSTSIIATDKTLTLTEGKMELAVLRTADESLALRIAALANEAFIENPEDSKRKWRVRGRPTDKALLLAAAEKGLTKNYLRKELEKIDEIPFNSQNKFIAALFKTKDDKKIIFTAGAPEKIIALSSKIKRKDNDQLFNKKVKKELEDTLQELASQGLRVIALAQKPFQKASLKTEEVDKLTFVGFVGLKDPLRKEAKEAVKLCKKAGIRTIIVTGDHLLTAKAVAQELDLKVGKENIMLGRQLDELSDEELQKKLNKINLFARVEPKHKLRIVQAWQDKNQVVAMTGDGINDAPALKKADIGVALGSGTDVAKEVSDLILLNDNFSIIVSAVEEGRAILDKIRKVITYLLSGSFAEIVLIGVSLLLGVPLPVTATQILWVNLIEDGLPSIALAFEPKEKDLMFQKPARSDIPLLTKEMKVIIFAIGIFTNLVLLGLFFWLYNEWGVSEIKHIRTVIFAGLTIDSLFYVFSCKSLRRNIWQINIFSSKFLLVSWVFGLVALLGAVYLPFLQKALKTVPLGARDWLILLGFGLVNLIAIEGVKYYFIARHQTN